MPTIKGITAQYDLLPAGRNPHYQPPPPSKTVSGPTVRKVSGPTIIDADTVILDLQTADWVTVEPGSPPQLQGAFPEYDQPREENVPAPFYRRLALTAYAQQMPPYTLFLSSGAQINLVA